MRFDLENHFLYSTSSSFGNHIKAKWHPFQFFYIQGDYRVLVEKINLPIAYLIYSFIIFLLHMTVYDLRNLI